MSEETMIERVAGHYWLSDLDRPRMLVAHWDGQFWTFMNSLYIVEDDDETEDGRRIMDRYRVLERISEPSPPVPILASRDATEEVLREFGQAEPD